MPRTRGALHAVLDDKRGLETFEYAILAVAFVIVVYGFVVALAPGVTDTFTDLGNWIVTQAAGLSER